MKRSDVFGVLTTIVVVAGIFVLTKNANGSNLVTALGSAFTGAVRAATGGK
jgi:hypothetical protein